MERGRECSIEALQCTRERDQKPEPTKSFPTKKMNTLKFGFSLTILLLLVMVAEAFARPPVIKPVRATPIKDSTTAIKAREAAIVDGKVMSNAELNGSLQTKPESGGSATIPNEVLNLVKSIVGAAALSLPAGTQLSSFYLLLLDKA